jgi:hypothetical protein
MNKFLRNPCTNSEDIFGCFFFSRNDLGFALYSAQQPQNDEYEDEAIALIEGLSTRKEENICPADAECVGAMPPLNVGTNAYAGVWQPQPCGYGPLQGGN